MMWVIGSSRAGKVKTFFSIRVSGNSGFESCRWSLPKINSVFGGLVTSNTISVPASQPRITLPILSVCWLPKRLGTSSRFRSSVIQNGCLSLMEIVLSRLKDTLNWGWSKSLDNGATEVKVNSHIVTWKHCSIPISQFRFGSLNWVNCTNEMGVFGSKSLVLGLDERSLKWSNAYRNLYFDFSGPMRGFYKISFPESSLLNIKKLLCS